MASQKRQTIKSQPQAKKLWWGVLVFLVLQTVWFVNLLVKFISSELPSGVTEGGRITDIIIALILLIMALAVIWGVYRIDKWAVIILWLLVLWAVITVAWVSIIANIVVVIGYHYILSRLNN